LFRSDELHALTDADLDVIADLGVRVLFDLRNDVERSLRPNRVLPNVDVHERSAPPHESAGTTLEDQIASGIAPQADDVEFGDVYVVLLTYLGAELRRILQLAVDAVDKPLLFHCVAGKDRTGITAAVLLGLLGVPDDAILDDYELTTRYWTAGRMDQLADFVAEHEADPDNVRQLLSARRPVLQRALTHLHNTWGDYDTYAIKELGVAPDLPDRLRAALLA
jgi:protein-tyrosine phosphatase